LPPPAQALDQPEVAEPLQSWREDDQEIGSMAGCGRECVGHSGRDHHQISFPGGDHLVTSEDLQFAIQDVEELG
jgi:hypothetical protein